MHITVEPPIKDTPNGGHNRKKPLYKGQMSGPNVSVFQRFHCILRVSVARKWLS